MTKTELPQGETIAPDKFLVLKNIKRRNLLVNQTKYGVLKNTLDGDKKRSISCRDEKYDRIDIDEHYFTYISI